MLHVKHFAQFCGGRCYAHILTVRLGFLFLHIRHAAQLIQLFRQILNMVIGVRTTRTHGIGQFVGSPFNWFVIIAR